MIRTVNKHNEEERQVKIQERVKLEKLRRYHKGILKGGLPPIPSPGSGNDLAGTLSLASYPTSKPQGTGSETGTSQGLPRLTSRTTSSKGGRTGSQCRTPHTDIMSMSGALGSKARPFGAPAKKSKKKGKKKGKKKKKVKSRPISGDVVTMVKEIDTEAED